MVDNLLQKALEITPEPFLFVVAKPMLTHPAQNESFVYAILKCNTL